MVPVAPFRLMPLFRISGESADGALRTSVPPRSELAGLLVLRPEQRVSTEHWSERDGQRQAVFDPGAEAAAVGSPLDLARGYSDVPAEGRRGRLEDPAVEHEIAAGGQARAVRRPQHASADYRGTYVVVIGRGQRDTPLPSFCSVPPPVTLPEIFAGYHGRALTWIDSVPVLMLRMFCRSSVALAVSSLRISGEGLKFGWANRSSRCRR